jgi:hypothetical protein
MGLAIRIGKDPDLLEAAGCLTQEKGLPNETQTSARAQKRRSGPPPDVAPGISNSVLLRRSPQWETLTALAKNLFDTEVDSKYFVKVAKALICRVLTKFFPTEMRKAKRMRTFCPYLCQNPSELPRIDQTFTLWNPLLLMRVQLRRIWKRRAR